MALTKRDKVIIKELQIVARQEGKLEKAALKAKPLGWKQALEEKLPDKVFGGLELAFCKGFSIVFSQGKTIIEKGIQKNTIQADQAIRDYAFQVKGRRKELTQIRKGANQSDLINLATTTVEGIGLGALGIGMPDIVLFLGTLMKGIYETALNYGFEYDTKQEQLLILKMMAASLSSGTEWKKRDREVDEMLELETVDITQRQFQGQLTETASVFAMDMLLLKFVQGLPVVGILGGAANPFYYNKVMKYVSLKYRKRYLLKWKEQRHA